MKINGRPLLRVALLVLGMGVAAQAERIARIRIESANPNVDPSALEEVVLGRIASKPGTTYDMRRVSQDIEELMKSGNFEDVNVRKEALTGDEIELVFVVLPKRMVRSFTYTGNEHFKDKKIRSMLTHSTGMPLDEGLLARDIAEIVRRYQTAGYFAATVTFAVQPVPDTDEVNVVLQISEGARAKLKKVEFTGNTVFSDGKLRKAVRTRRAWWRYIFRWGNYYNRDLAVVDKDLLRQAYTEEGYLDFAVTEASESFSPNGKWVVVTYRLEEGSQYTVSTVSLAGNERFSNEELAPLVKTQPGDIYRTSAEERDTNSLQRVYEPLGYLDLRCFPVHNRDPQTRTVAVVHQFREGQPSHIRDVLIVGNTVTRDRVIRREMAIHPGDAGDAGLIRQSESRLKNLNYFDKVEISPLATEQDDLRDLRVSLVEKRTGQLMVGGTFSSEDSLMGFVEVTQSNFDWRNWPSFRGGGQRMRMRAQIGTEYTNFLISFTEPWWLDRRLRLDLDAFLTSRYEDSYDQTDTGLGMSVTRAWRTSWRQTFGIRIRHVALDGFENDLYANALYPIGHPLNTDSDLLLDMQENDEVFANRLIYSMARDTRDRPTMLFPTSGSRLEFGGELITRALGSYSDYYLLTAEGTKYYPVFKQSVLKLRGMVGVGDEIAGDDIGVFDRFFAGGTGSIRGFERREVGPVDDEWRENPMGGRTMAVGTVELIRPLASWAQVSVFSDFGNVWADSFEVSGGINASVGVGLQLQLPVGPISLAYGIPVMTDQEHLSGNSGRLHFSIGTSF